MLGALAGRTFTRLGTKRHLLWATLLCAAACGTSTDTAKTTEPDPSPVGAGFGTSSSGGSSSGLDGPPFDCVSTSPPAKADPSRVEIASAFAGTYKAYVLGALPGIPASRLGGTMLSPSDPNMLLVAVNSDTASGAIAQVKVRRDACGHITGFDGDATIFSQTPFVDANLLLGPNKVLFYSRWPENKLSEIPLSSGTATTYTIALSTVGVAGGGPGGIGFVPPNLKDPGGLRAVTWPDGFWYHLTYEPSGATFKITESEQITTLSNGPGGFAYVPQGSPGFPKQSIITCEWDVDKVVVYDADEQGDPANASRSVFFTKFPKPWGAYFEPKTGDFIFLTWGGALDEVYIVRGFTPPPPPPDSPK